MQRSAVNDTALWITAFDLFVLEAQDNVRLAAVAVEVHQYLARDTNSLRKIHAQSHVELVFASDQSSAESLGAREFQGGCRPTSTMQQMSRLRRMFRKRAYRRRLR